MYFKTLIIIAFTVISLPLFGQSENIIYDNYIYKNNIKTVTLHNNKGNFSYPVIKIDSDEQLILEFDDLNPQLTDYSYTIIHCTHDWQVSDLSEYEYISGYKESDIRDSESSFSTLKAYNHYKAYFPNDDMKPLLSGNYLLLVFKNYDRNDIVITRRFSISEDIINIDANVKRASFVDYMQSSQEIEFTINQSIINNPQDRLNIVIGQNKRQDNLIYNIKPTFIQQGKLIYNDPRQLVFPGGNEYMFFNCKNKKYAISGIESVYYEEPVYRYHVVSSVFDPYSTYLYNEDINGEFFIATDDGTNYETDADYVLVTFTIFRPSPLLTEDVYVFGAISDWRLSDNNKMIYNSAKGAYEVTMLLKQGFYNYEYLICDSKTGILDANSVRKSHYETENDYIIYVYYNQEGTVYDKLLGVKILNTQKKY